MYPAIPNSIIFDPIVLVTSRGSDRHVTVRNRSILDKVTPNHIKKFEKLYLKFGLIDRIRMPNIIDSLKY